MSCVRKNRRPESENMQNNMERDDSDERSFFRRILKRISVISSIMIRFLRDIRAGILRLFGKGDRGSQYPAFGTNQDNDNVETNGLNSIARNKSIGSKISNLRKRATSKTKKRSVAKSVAHNCERLEETGSGDGRSPVHTSTEPLVARDTCRSSMPIAGVDGAHVHVAHVHIKNQASTADTNVKLEHELSQENTKKRNKEDSGYVCVETTSEYVISPGQTTQAANAPNTPTATEIHQNMVDEFLKHIDPGFCTEREKADIAEKIAQCVQHCQKGTAIAEDKKEQVIKLIKKATAKSVPATSKPDQREHKGHTVPVVRSKKVTTEPVNKQNPMHKSAESGTFEVYQLPQQTPPTNWKQNKAFEARLKQSQAKTETPARTSPLQENQTPMPACTEAESKTPAAAADATAVVKQADVGDKQEQPKKKPKLKFGEAIRRKFSPTPNQTAVVPEPTVTEVQTVQDKDVSEVGEVREVKVVEAVVDPKDILLTDAREITINRARVIRMIHMVITHCLSAFIRQKWKYRMQLVAKVHLRPTGENDWSPLYKDFLFDPGFETGNPTVVELRVAKFDRLVSLEPYLSFIGIDPTAEQLLQALQTIIVKTTRTDISRNQPEALKTLGSPDELYWCTEMVDVMTYISYYVVVGCAKIIKNIHRTEPGSEQRKILVQAVHNHVVKKFEHSISSMSPRMRHAIEFFCLEDVATDVIPATTNNAGECQTIQGDTNTQGSSAAGPPEVTTPVPKKLTKKKSRNTNHERPQQQQQATTDPKPVALGCADSGETGRGDASGSGAEDATKKDKQPTLENATIANDTLANSVATELGIEANQNVASTVTGVLEQGAGGAVSSPEANTADDGNTGDCLSSTLYHMNNALAADFQRDAEWDFADYVTYIETNNTLDYGALEVVAGHGETPNKKKLCSEIREKKKTKGIPNKHLEQPKPNHEVYEYKNDNNEEPDADYDAPNKDSPTEACPAEITESQSETPESPNTDKPDAPALVLDDREYNMVPEEVIRKDESKLKDLEEVYTIGSAEKKKDKHKKKKEKKPKGVKLQLDFDFPDSTRW